MLNLIYRSLIFNLLLLFQFLLSGGLIKAENKENLCVELLDKAKSYQYINTDSVEFFLDQIKYNYKGTQNDSIFAEYLLLLGVNTSITGSTSLAMQYFEQSNHLFTSVNYTYGIAESYLNMGEVHYNWGKFDKALIYFNKAKNISQKYKYEILYVRSLNYIGKYYHSKGNLEQSLSYYTKALDLAKAIGATTEIMSLYNKIGKDYKTLGNYPKSLDCFIRSQQLIPNTDNKIEEATTYNHLGNIYQVLRDFKKALFFHKQALELRKEVNYKEGIAKSLKNIGEVYFDLQQYDSALVCFDQSYLYCKQIGYAKGIVKNLYGKGLIYEKEEKHSLAIKNYHEALDYSKSIGYAIGESRVYLLLANIYKKIAKYDQAIRYCNEGLAIAKKEDIKSNTSEFYKILSGVYALNGDYKEAFMFYKEHSHIKDEIINLETNKKIAELQTEYKVDLKNRENEVLKQENQIKELRIKRKNLVILFAIIVSFLLIALVLIMYGRFLNKKNANIKLTVLNDNIIQKNKELDKLNKKMRKSKDQQVKLFSIISHELRNPLYWFRNLIQLLSNQIDVLDKSMISKSLDSLNESATNTFHLMDNLLNWSKSQLGNIQYVPESFNLAGLIKENVSLILPYSELKEINIKTALEDKIEVKADKAMIKTVIRNLLSNAIKFTPNKGTIEVKIIKNSSKVKVEVCDSGVGMDQNVVQRILNASGSEFLPSSDKETGNGLGLILTKEFIKKNGGELLVNSSPGNGSVFGFELDLISN